MAYTLEKTRTPGIFARGSRYVVPYRHRGKQHRPSFRTMAEAKAFKARLAGGDVRTPTTRVTVEDYANGWLPTYAGRTSQGLTERTRAAYRSSLDHHCLPYFGRWKMADVRKADVRAFVAELQAKGLAPTSVKKTFLPLAIMFATAHEDEELPTNPFAGVRVNMKRATDVEEEHAKALTLAQLTVFLGHVPAADRLFFRLLADTGLRVSEAIGLNVGDVAFGTPTMLRIRRQCYRGTMSALKTRNGRRDLPLPSDLARDLWTLTQGRPADAPLFVTRAEAHRGGGRVSDPNLRRRVLAPAARAAGAPWMGFHTLRHTCASRLLASGKNIAQVSKWLGHADPGFTLRVYVHLMDEGLGDAEFMTTAVDAEDRPAPWATRLHTAP